MAKKFSAQLGEFRDLTVGKMRYVMRSSISDVLVGAQTTQIGITQGAESFEVGKIPVGLTAELVNSLTVDGATGPASYEVAIAGMELGEEKRFAWTAPHALPIEQGWTTESGTNVPGRYFVSHNAAKFDEHVRRRAAEVRV